MTNDKQWKAEPHPCGASVWILNGDGDLVATCHNHDAPDDAEETSPQTWEHAYKIVNAVNCYDELVAALSACVSALQPTRNMEEEDAIKQARSALAKSKGIIC